MRAKVKLNKIEKHDWGAETLTFNAVSKDTAYPPDGSDEDNTYASYTPSATFTLTVANPNLIGKFTEGEKYYVDFTKIV